MDILTVALIGLLGIVVGLLIFGIVLHRKQVAVAFEKAQHDAKDILVEARREADTVVKNASREAKEDGRRRRQTFENEARQRREEFVKLEKKLQTREAALEKRLKVVETKESEIKLKDEQSERDQRRYQHLTMECEQIVEKSRKTLESIARMSPEEARRELLRSLETEARKTARERVRQIEEETRQTAEGRARSIISLAVQRIASEHVNDSTVSVVALPSDDMKGRIIGREGRNIRALENATGCDLIIDDTPEAVILSCFNPVRREIAKIALERLIQDGRIHPARIEETVKRVESELDQIMRECGEQALFDTGITDVHPELISMLGRLRFRTTGQQTVLQHAIETAHICGIIAGELDFDVKIAKRSGLLHDVGKAVDQETEGHHSAISAEFCRKFGESEGLVQAVRAHHDEDLSSAPILTVILHAANSLSGSRPGARKTVLESFVKRLDNMEKLVRGFDGIESAYVLQTGREVRAIVTPSIANDEAAVDLSNEIAFKLRDELTFPGKVRVTVIRESKFVEFAT